MSNKIKKVFVLIALFVLPLLLYIFLSLGVNNFGKLPVLAKHVIDVSEINGATTKFKKNISVVVFLGNDIQHVKGGFFNLNQKIYKPFYGFKDFQIVAIYPKSKKNDVQQLKKEMGKFTDMKKWKFISALPTEINTVFESFNTNEKLENLYSQRAYLVDKENKLRGRTYDKDTTSLFSNFIKRDKPLQKNNSSLKLFGYNMQSVGELNDKMKDDVKVLLAEYRLALKKNNATREI